MTRFFAAQAAEEHVHAMKFLTYIQDAGGDVAIPALAAPAPSFTGAEGAVAAACPRRRTSPQASTIWSTSREARTTMPPIVFLQWFVTEQVEEVATMTELLQIVRRAGEGGLLLVEDYIARSGGHTGA